MATKKDLLTELELERKAIKENKTGYIKIGDDFFILSKADTPIKSVESVFKKEYKDKLDGIENKFKDVVAEDIAKEHNDGLIRINEWSNKKKQNYVMPVEYPGLPAMIWNNEVVPCRLVNYTISMLEDTNKRLVDKDILTKELCDSLGVPDYSSGNLINMYFKIESDLRIPVLYAYSKKNNRLYTPYVITPHSTSTGTYEVCTGNTTADKVFKMSHNDFIRYITTINAFSFNSGYVTTSMSSPTSPNYTHFYDWLKNHAKIVGITPKEGSKWKI